MIEAQRPRVLIVGAGRRIENNFLPALRCLDAALDPVGIHATSPTRMTPLSQTWGVPAIADLAQFDLTGVDLVAISTPTAANAAVVASLLEHKHRLTLLIDTPIAWNRREFRDTWRMLRQFPRAFVAEDFMNFPPFALVRQAVRSGLIGEVKHIELDRTGYLYHGLALARSFASFEKVLSTKKVQTDKGLAVKYKLKSGLTIDVIGPYERMGRLTVKGSSGVIVYDSQQENLTSSSPREYTVHTKRGLSGFIEGYDIANGGKLFALSCPELTQMMPMPFDDKSDLNLLRGCGLISIFRSISQPDGLNEAYGVTNGLYDGTVAKLAHRGVFPFDPFVWVGTDATGVARTVSGLL